MGWEAYRSANSRLASVNIGCGTLRPSEVVADGPSREDMFAAESEELVAAGEVMDAVVSKGILASLTVRHEPFIAGGEYWRFLVKERSLGTKFLF